MTATPDDATSETPSATRSWARDVAVTLAGAVIYFGARVVVEGQPAEAIANADRLQRVERSLGLDVGQDVQTWALGRDWLRTVGNVSYVWLHWPLLIAVLVLLYLRDHERFIRLRTAMFWSGAVGLVLFTAVPTAPPRFMPGFIGTVSDDARRHYLSYPLSWTNQFAALPSFHVGWTLIACLAVAGLSGRRIVRAAALVPATLVALSVVTTGNHYVIDSVLGAVIAVGAFALAAPTRRRSGSRAIGPAPG